MANSGEVPTRGVKKRPFRRKRRSWLFKIERTTNHGVTEADLLASVCHRYSTVKKLMVRRERKSEQDATARKEGASSPPGGGGTGEALAVLVEIRFAGPQPSESCGELLCLLLGGDSVQAWPVELPRGRKRKNSIMSTEENDTESRVDAAAPGTGASGVQGILPPPPRRRRDGCDYDDSCDQGRRQHAPQYHQQPHLPGMHQHQYHQSSATHSHLAVSDSTPFPVAQPPREARTLHMLPGNNAATAAPGGRGCGGGDGDRVDVGASSGVGVGGPLFLAPEGHGRGSDSADAGGDRALLPMEGVMVQPLQKDCDLEGRPFSMARMTSNGARPAAGPVDDRQCHLVFTGLEETGHDLNGLRVTALFGVDAVHQTATMSGPLQVGGDGQVYSALFYPSLQEIWPELYGMPNIPLVEVDIEVEILSDSGGEYRYHGPRLKVVYHRAAPRDNFTVARQSARGSSRGSTGPQTPVSYPVDANAADDGEFRPIYPDSGAVC